MDNVKFEQLEETVKAIKTLSEKYDMPPETVLKCIDIQDKEISRSLVTGIIDQVAKIIDKFVTVTGPHEEEPIYKKKYPFERDDEPFKA